MIEDPESGIGTIDGERRDQRVGYCEKESGVGEHEGFDNGWVGGFQSEGIES